MRIAQIVVEAWLGSAVIATFAWVGFVEFCQWQERRRERAYALALEKLERHAVAEAERIAWESAVGRRRAS